ncbi:MAG: TldD/PmbA family protein [Candidatus Krumholzibacteriota bacterium]|nr:TldD/PmbA family protein [Candidatus Krumholzibacteriota bacterium]
MTLEEMKSMADFSVRAALAEGAHTAETSLSGSTDFSVTVRNGEIENLQESVSNLIRVTVSVDSRKASVASNDLAPDSIRRLIAEGVELSRIMDSDEYFSLPDKEELGRAPRDLALIDPDYGRLTTDAKIKTALELEKIACGLDDRIISDGASFSNGRQALVCANSLGFCEGYEKTFHSIDLSCAAEDRPAAGENTGKKQSSYWFSAATSLPDLESLERVASRAVHRTLRKLGAVKPETCEVPVVFDDVTARDFMRWIAAAVNGGNIYRKSSFLADKLDHAAAADLVTMIDDPFRPGGLGSRPFDGEGVSVRKNVVFEKGRLRSYLLSSYQARKIGLRTTGSAGGISNFYLEPGAATREEIISSIDSGLYLTSLSGPGANWSSGDFSQGGQGIWIERGELSFPVNEFTIAGTFPRILAGISMIAGEMEWKSTVASPAFKIDRLTISGT